MSRSFLFYTEMAFRKLLFCERILQSKVIILNVFEWVYWNIWHSEIIGVLETEVIYFVQSLSILKMLELYRLRNAWQFIILSSVYTREYITIFSISWTCLPTMWSRTDIIMNKGSFKQALQWRLCGAAVIFIQNPETQNIPTSR